MRSVNMGKDLYWKSNYNAQTKTNVIEPVIKPNSKKQPSPQAQKMKFDVQRQKDTLSKLETLSITPYYSGDPYVTITTNLIDLDKDIKALRAYGIALDRLEMNDLKQIIDDSDYAKYNSRHIKTFMRDNKAISVCNAGQFDYVVKNEDESTFKCIALKSEDMQSYIEDFRKELSGE